MGLICGNYGHAVALCPALGLPGGGERKRRRTKNAEYARRHRGKMEERNRQLLALAAASRWSPVTELAQPKVVARPWCNGRRPAG